MDATASDPSSPRSRRAALQGPRLPRLVVNVESLKIKKPTAVTPRRPKKSHQVSYVGVDPADFKALVQRLTGGPPVSAAPAPGLKMEYAGRSVVSSAPRELLLSPTTAAVSAASARLAATERAVRPLPLPRPPSDYGEDADCSAGVLGLPQRPGILSPAALPPAACSWQFSALPFDPSCLPWIKETSPFFQLPAASRLGLLGCLFTLNPSTLLPGRMPCPATVSTPDFFSSSVLEMCSTKIMEPLRLRETQSLPRVPWLTKILPKVTLGTEKLLAKSVLCREPNRSSRQRT